MLTGVINVGCSIVPRSQPLPETSLHRCLGKTLFVGKECAFEAWLMCSFSRWFQMFL